jgi:hypothetical protein
MKCPIMVQLIKKLDTERAEQCNPKLTMDGAEKKKQLRSIEAFLDLHQRTYATCRQFNPHGTQFVQNASRGAQFINLRGESVPLEKHVPGRCRTSRLTVRLSLS